MKEFFFSYSNIGDNLNKLKINIIGLFLIGICFYTTEYTLQRMKEKDPIMIEIKEKSKEYEEKYHNAQVNGNDITSGKKGKEVDYNTSYSKMKQYGAFNESLITTKEVLPIISIEKNYDKYLVSGNQKEKKVSLVFPIKQDEEIESIITVLNKKEVPGTFFIDGTILEKYTNVIRKNKQHEFEILSYQDSYQTSFFTTAIAYLEMVTKKEANYCYTEKDNQELLDICKKRRLHTIKANELIKKELYRTIKNNLDSTKFYSIESNSYNLKELSTTIDYIEEKGYQITKLEELLSE